MFGSKQSFLGLFELQFKMNDKKGKERKGNENQRRHIIKIKKKRNFTNKSPRRSLKNSMCLF